MPRQLVKADLEYELPSALIATAPVRPRDSARMMVIHRDDGGRIEHRRVADLGEYLVPGDLVCMNNTSVLPARLSGHRTDTRGRIDGLFLEHVHPCWRVMLRSNGRLRAGQSVTLLGPNGNEGVITLRERDGDAWLVEPAADTRLETVGHTPIPPYILRARHDGAVSDQEDRDWYRTVFADAAEAGSVAAPTAGLHFTPALLERLSDAGIDQATVTLHVGAGTFAPVSAERLEDHVMHEEAWSIGTGTLNALAARRGSQPRGRIIAVGTTTVRVLESLPDPFPAAGLSGRTRLMISPPWEFRHVDALLTNFHLPHSTLLALVAAMIGIDLVKSAYAEAISEGYRFYSYGDAMLIL
ncbi:MAG: tRNA preQ1(34) S-adenosylmethionine ribosyltransferase-isomerase QueA [Phycisphaerales bacterium]|nr:tRNA preQ1(34) S-adenosylmethionine ribosyltransferase-isomerase QueA [Phycisphaerales bacterium]